MESSGWPVNLLHTFADLEVAHSPDRERDLFFHRSLNPLRPNFAQLLHRPSRLFPNQGRGRGMKRHKPRLLAGARLHCGTLDLQDQSMNLFASSRVARKHDGWNTERARRFYVTIPMAKRKSGDQFPLEKEGHFALRRPMDHRIPAKRLWPAR